MTDTGERYLIEGEIGAGSMQRVFSALDTRLDRRVAVKTPREGVHDRRFRRGASTSARINHPNVAATLDYFEDDTTTFVVEELISGRDLKNRLASDFTFLDPSLTAHVFHQLVRAVEVAHRAGVVHRDLKPSNIMVSDDLNLSVVKLTDFGIAKLAEAQLDMELEEYDRDDQTLTTSNTLLGATPYLAPECWHDWRSSGQPSDIWALGCILFELSTGRPPFGTGRPAIGRVMGFQSSGEKVEFPDSFGGKSSALTLASDLRALVTDCLRADPSKRPDATTLLTRCDGLCYLNTPRELGTIDQFPAPFGGGNTYGTIRSDQAVTRFFHREEFFAQGSRPETGQRVSYSVFPGLPYHRASPVLLLRPGG